MSEAEKNEQQEKALDAEHQDQDSEPSNNAPDDGRPDLTKASDERRDANER
ncbi:hypothetical protein [Jiangella asiatica]|uniref:hypothetical protein n=1 Tax=Jiangella asiatica TaxID=2530372 RepID=UPI0013A5D909|nr:hypothetical protein [Jiangella asiatica]